jgi:hypothetical protein
MRRHIGLVGILTFIFAIGLISVLNWQSTGVTISHHIAQADWSKVLFGAVTVICGVCLAYAMLGTIKQRWQFAGRLYTIIAVIVPLCVWMIGFCPAQFDTGSIISIVHEVASWGMIFAVFVLVLLVMSVAWSEISTATKAVTIAMVGYSLFALIVKYAWNQLYVDWVFVLEAIFIILSLVFMLLLMYSTPREKVI